MWLTILTLSKSLSLLNEQSDKFQKEAKVKTQDKEEEEKEKRNFANKSK